LNENRERRYGPAMLYPLDLISSPKDYVEILAGIIPTCAGFFGIEKYFGLTTGIIGIINNVGGLAACSN
jgi:hypothetical protein